MPITPGHNYSISYTSIPHKIFTLMVILNNAEQHTHFHINISMCQWGILQQIFKRPVIQKPFWRYKCTECSRDCTYVVYSLSYKPYSPKVTTLLLLYWECTQARVQGPRWAPWMHINKSRGGVRYVYMHMFTIISACWPSICKYSKCPHLSCGSDCWMCRLTSGIKRWHDQ